MLTAPALTLVFLVVVAGLGTAFVWMFWEIEQVDVKAASQRRSGRVADLGSCAASIAQCLVTGFAVHHSQFSDKLHLFFDTSLDGNLRRCGVCTQACMSGKEFVRMENFAVPP